MNNHSLIMACVLILLQRDHQIPIHRALHLAQTLHHALGMLDASAARSIVKAARDYLALTSDQTRQQAIERLSQTTVQDRILADLSQWIDYHS